MKMDGVDSVDVTLQRGVVRVVLVPGNAVTLTGLRRVIRDAGYTPQDAVVTVDGALSGDRSSLLVTGTPTALRLAPEEKHASAFEEIARIPASPRETVEVVGRIPAPSSPDAAETLYVRTVRRK